MNWPWKDRRLAIALIPLVILLLISVRPLLPIGGFTERPSSSVNPENPSVSKTSQAGNSANLLDQREIDGLFALQQGEAATALGLLEKVQAEGSLTEAGKIGLGRAFYATGEIEAAIQCWLEAAPSPESLDLLAGAYQASGQYEEGIESLKGLLRHYPGEAALYYKIGLMYAATSPEASVAYFEQAAALDPSLMGVARDFQRSIQTARIQDEPAYTLLITGRILAGLEQWELAAEAFRRSVEVRPDYAESWAFLGEARQHNQGERPEDYFHSDSRQNHALLALKKSIELDPASVAGNLFMAKYWQRAEQYEVALVYLEIAANKDPGNPVVQAEIGNTIAKSGNLQSAMLYYQRAVELAPKETLYWQILAEFSIHHQIQVREVALPAARQGVLLAPKDPIMLDLLGQVFHLLGDLNSADRFFKLALEEDAEFLPSHLHIGLNFLMLGQNQIAREHLLYLVSLAPESPSAERAQRLLDQYFP
jgi:tetratricopeptide (TPR) repeat protein